MTKATKRRLCIGLPILGTALLILLVFISHKQPSYANRTLASWMEDLPAPISFSPVGWSLGPTIRPFLTPREKEAGNAIRAIGTNASPFLLATIRRKEGKITTAVLSWINKQKFLKSKLYSASDRHLQACSALQELGYEALPAWTEILLDEELPAPTRQFAAICLANLRHAPAHGPLFPGDSHDYSVMMASVRPVRDEPWRVLTKALGSANILIRSNAAYFIAAFGVQAGDAIPVLMRHTNDPDPGVRAACFAAMTKCEPDTALALIRSLNFERGRRRAGVAASLGLLKQRPEESIQALLLAAQDEDYQVREAAISALGDFQSKASNAIPLLLDSCNDTNKFVRRTATNALLRIIPNSADQPIKNLPLR